MAKSQLFRGALAWILRRGGAFPVQRGRHDEQTIATALEILEQGGVVVIYPEGGRSRSARIGERARPGVGRLALQSQQAVADEVLGVVRELYASLERPTPERRRLAAAPHRQR
jgi:1-acyl-sn-glycerol-3-phosphate acyltransferase